MPTLTIIFGAILTTLGAYGYLGAEEAHRSVTALIPAFIGGPMMLCGLVALASPPARKHVMHLAVVFGLGGAVAGLVRGSMSAIKLIAPPADQPPVNVRALSLVLAMAAVCAVYVVLCVRSFIEARRRRNAAEA